MSSVVSSGTRSEQRSSLTAAWLRTLAVGVVSFGGVGAAIAWGFAPPRVVLVIDRAYCADWASVTAQYTTRYRAHQAKELQIDKLVLVGDLGEEIPPSLPTPEQFAELRTFGRSNQAAIDRSAKAAPPGSQVEVLRCGS